MNVKGGLSEGYNNNNNNIWMYINEHSIMKPTNTVCKRTGGREKWEYNGG
jgi:hypothetical protein